MGMTTSRERRDFSRVSSNVAVRWYGETLDKSTREYLSQIAGNISLRGMFVEADRPPPAGTMIRLEIRLASANSDAEPVQAKAIVRWRRRWSRPRGMGVEFLDLKGLGQRNLKEWLQSVLRAPNRNGS